MASLSGQYLGLHTSGCQLPKSKSKPELSIFLQSPLFCWYFKNTVISAVLQGQTIYTIS